MNGTRGTGQAGSSAVDTAASGLRIFVSYRRSDCLSQAGRLADTLEARLPAASVFMDIESIAPGVHFVEAIEREIARCDVVLALIGDDWLRLLKERAEVPEDFVRRELEVALREGIKVQPVLVEGAEMPPANELPEPLKQLAYINAYELDDARWRREVGQLIELLQRIPPGHRRAGSQGTSVVEEPDPFNGLKGSRRRIAEWVNLRGDELQKRLFEWDSLAAYADGPIDWLSPLAADGFREIGDDLWHRADLPGPSPQEDGFWPARGPVWDAVARVPGRGGEPGSCSSRRRVMRRSLPLLQAPPKGTVWS